MAKKKKTAKKALSKKRPTLHAPRPTKRKRPTPHAPRPTKSRLTLAHVTHEAVDKIGGIGAVLEGLIASPVYRQRVGRTILVGPTRAEAHPDAKQRLGDTGKVLYSSVDRIDAKNLAGVFRPIEWAFNVAIVYGTRTFNPPGEDRAGEAEVLLIDVFRANPDRLNVFKLRLWETFGLDSSKYEHSWDYEEYCRLAEPALYALRALLAPKELPCVLFGHEYMGVPALLAALIDGKDDFRTVFHAHECATARRIVEDHPGHDTMFYNVLARARQDGRFIDDVFGDQSWLLRHALIGLAHACDGIIAVGDYTKQEMRFLSLKLDEHPIDVVYNGVPAMKVSPALKKKSRALLLDYAERLVGQRPDWVMTHVTRPVISKGIWRDLRLCHELDTRLAERGETAVHFILTSAAGPRRAHDVANMERDYGWPRDHRHGYPDLVGPEVDYWKMIEPFNLDHKHVQVVLVNQFGWSRAAIGQRLPRGMDIADLRRATDVELGMATYEPFGISPLEPLAAGAVCVISSVCGCAGFIEHVTAGRGAPNVLRADYVSGAADHRTIEELKTIGEPERTAIEVVETARLADELVARLPRTDKARARLLADGQKLVAKMGWDNIIADQLWPLMDRVVNGRK